MSRKTQTKGDIGVTQGIATFTKLGYVVSLPITESMPYDFIVDTGRYLYKIQARYTSTNEIDLRRIHSNSTGYKVKRMDKSKIDWIYVYTSDGGEYLISNSISNINSVRMNDTNILTSIIQLKEWENSI